ncbi:MAG: hypothetical protein RIS92_3243 [Verrucomicrobiota bacterium]
MWGDGRYPARTSALMEAVRPRSASVVVVLFGDPIAVSAAGDIEHPSLILEVPLHGLSDAGGESLGGFPTEFSGDF